MPSRGTTSRNVRLSDALWRRVKARAESEGRTVSDVIREHLEDYAPAESEDEPAGAL